MITSAQHKKFLYTPLRYPGGKTSLYLYFDELIKINGISNAVYVEPFAGGAGAALSLLLTERVQSIVINDFDSAIAAFWRSVVNETERFLSKLESIPVDVDQWRVQKSAYIDPDSDPFDRGFATFFLNRTNRSGILRAGPIGGYAQEGKWKIDARFDRRALAGRIALIAKYRSRIELREQDGLEIIQEFVESPNTFTYVDPPYYVQGSELYLNAFAEADHVALAEALKQQRSGNWVLSYDNVEPIRELYSSFRSEEFDLRYSAHSSRVGQEVMVFSDSIASE
jgi:DNA adenine methylase